MAENVDVDHLSPNHGGIVIVAAPGINMSPISSLSDHPTTFEDAGARVVSGQFAGIVLVLYRPDSAAVLFYDELAAILDRFVVYCEPIYIAGDFNIRLNSADDPHAIQFRLLIESFIWSATPQHVKAGWYVRRCHLSLRRRLPPKQFKSSTSVSLTSSAIVDD